MDTVHTWAIPTELPARFSKHACITICRCRSSFLLELEVNCLVFEEPQQQLSPQKYRKVGMFDFRNPNRLFFGCFMFCFASFYSNHAACCGVWHISHCGKSPELTNVHTLQAHSSASAGDVSAWNNNPASLLPVLLLGSCCC
jgi:hypothetical protein